MAAVVAEADVVGRVGECYRCPGSAEKPLDVLGLRRVSDQEPMLAQGPQLSGCGPRLPGCFLQGLVEIEALHSLALFPCRQAPQQIADFVFSEARQAHVDLGTGRKLGQQPGEQLFVPGARDTVEGEARAGEPAPSIDRARSLARYGVQVAGRRRGAGDLR